MGVKTALNQKKNFIFIFYLLIKNKMEASDMNKLLLFLF